MFPTHTYTRTVLTSTYLLRADLVSVLIFVFIRLKFSPPVTQFPIVENNFSLIKHGDKRTEINSDKQVKLILFSSHFLSFFFLFPLYFPIFLLLSLSSHSLIPSSSPSFPYSFCSLKCLPSFAFSFSYFLSLPSFSHSLSQSLFLLLFLSLSNSPPLFLSTRLNLHTLSYFLCTLFPPPSHTFFAAFSSLFFSFSFYQCCRGNII